MYPMRIGSDSALNDSPTRVGPEIQPVVTRVIITLESVYHHHHHHHHP